jgi:GNAT superfamily N-acetyltransferase
MKNHSNDYRIIPFSKELLNNAIVFMEAVFPYKPDQKSAKQSFRDSLTQPNSKQQYWLAVNPHGEIVGVTGLYHDYKDKSVVWLGWFGVHPQHRRHGVGSILLEFAISEAIKKGFSVLKLYSSFDKNERAAHHLYRKYGFVQTRANAKADKIFFAKELK